MHVVDPVTLDFPAGRAGVSSTLIRSFVEAGAIDEASRCLGREFCLFGRVVPGAGRGSKVLGFPTVNLQIQQQVVPGDGVYAGKAALAGQEFPAAISIGCNPTFGGEQRTVEAFLIGAKGDLQGSRMALRFVRRIGEQRRFKSAEALKAQIAKDVQRVREIIK
jgi:riboflavin kinase/FMN adenylyltransferase